jgi:hypothetical protein
MTRVMSGLLVAGALLIGPPALAQPVGTFNVAGEGYTGTVTVTQTGQTFDVVWRVQNQSFRGVGIFLNGVLSVGYTGEGQTGVALYRESQPGVWEGPWAFVGEQQTHTERWTRSPGGGTAPSK